MHSGLFISFEGTEGSGKTTQMKLLVERLRHEGLTVTENQEPGTTVIGRQIRSVLLDPSHEEMAPMTELLLMFASRTQAVAEIIAPALRQGHIAVSDRFTDSTLAYQGQARGLGFELVREMHRLTLGNLWPDLTLCIAVDVETGLARAHRRNLTAGNGNRETRIDQQSLAFHQNVMQGYKNIAASEPQRFRVIDGNGDPATVASKVWNEVGPLLRAVTA
jgi:dTMP kinase